MPKSLLISLDVLVIGFIISFIIAILIKALTFCIRHILNRATKKSEHI